MGANFGCCQGGRVDHQLAVHGLNLAAGDEDFLVVTELTGERLVPQPERYFTTPTPGLAKWRCLTPLRHTV